MSIVELKERPRLQSVNNELPCNESCCCCRTAIPAAKLGQTRRRVITKNQRSMCTQESEVESAIKCGLCAVPVLLVPVGAVHLLCTLAAKTVLMIQFNAYQSRNSPLLAKWSRHVDRHWDWFSDTLNSGTRAASFSTAPQLRGHHRNLACGIAASAGRQHPRHCLQQRLVR